MTNASTYCLKAKTEYGEKMFGCELFRMWEICYSAVRLTKKTAMFINVDINLVFCLKYLNANFSTLSSWHFACLFGVHSYLILQGLPLQKGRVKTILQPLFSATSGNNMTFYGFSSWAHLSPCLIQTNNICLCTKYIADTVLSFKSPQTWLVVLGLFFFLTSSWMMCKVKQQVYFFMLTLDTWGWQCSAAQWWTWWSVNLYPSVSCFLSSGSHFSIGDKDVRSGVTDSLNPPYSHVLQQVWGQVGRRGVSLFFLKDRVVLC